MHSIEPTKPSIDEARQAVKTLIRWAGDNPNREGLLETPDRVLKAYGEWFRGYEDDPSEILKKTFGEIEEYSQPVTLNDITFESYCEHHMAPIIGLVSISYIPNGRVVGISKLARLVDTFSKRLQVQEKMTAQIAKSIQHYLKPKGVAVCVRGDHHCMCTRGVNKKGISMVTHSFLGDFLTDPNLRKEFHANLEK
tara:strand:+ start:112 stop:696 length:585 start_codon:yes stop_codon:yes gene_type:complete